MTGAFTAEDDVTSSFDRLREARAELEAVIAEIRQVEGFGQFLAPPTFEDVSRAAHARPLVYLAAAEAGGIALVVRGGEVENIDLPELTAESLGDQVHEYLYRQHAFRVTHDAADQHRRWREWAAQLDQVTGWLWPVAMGPVIERLGLSDGQAQVALVPCGPLALLPLHAAWIEDGGRPTGRRYAIDHAVWTYTANGRALTACREAADAIPGRRVLAVADPPSGRRRLPLIASVSAAVRARFPQGFYELSDAAATVVAVEAALTDADLLHLGCHGSVDLDDPLGGRVLLAGGAWTLADIMRTRLRVRLAVLAACDTAVVGADLPDEVVSLPTGLVQAGAAAVIASMWQCDELATALVLTEFYRGWRDDSPAAALAAAQRYLRDATREELQDRWERALDDGAGWLPAGTGDTLLNQVLLDPTGDDPRPWSGVETWAALTYTGA